jgi:hypothetical protein
MHKYLQILLFLFVASCKENNHNVFQMEKSEVIYIIHRFYPDEAFTQYEVGDISNISLGTQKAPDDWGEISVFSEGIAKYDFLSFSSGHTVLGDMGKGGGRQIDENAILNFKGHLNIPVYVQIAYMNDNNEVILIHKMKLQQGVVNENIRWHDILIFSNEQ